MEPGSDASARGLQAGSPGQLLLAEPSDDGAAGRGLRGPDPLTDAAAERTALAHCCVAAAAADALVMIVVVTNAVEMGRNTLESFFNNFLGVIVYTYNGMIKKNSYKNSLFLNRPDISINISADTGVMAVHAVHVVLDEGVLNDGVVREAVQVAIDGVCW